jgi:3-oxoacyl-[acyl-carrier protein] reductase
VNVDLGITGRAAIVCAASQGLGKATASALAREGADVVICSRDRAKLDRAALEIGAAAPGARVHPVVTDLTKADQIRRLVADADAAFGRIDILVTNAGGPPVAAFQDLDDDRWEAGLTLTLKSVIRIIREVLPHMQRRNWGRIVNITSISARQPINDLVISSTARPGILGLSKVLANQYAREGILVNSVTPGYILTDRQRELGDARAASRGVPFDEYMRDLVRDVPAGRLGRPEELADVIAFLCSERAGYVTGTAIAVDGGMTKGLF